MSCWINYQRWLIKWNIYLLEILEKVIHLISFESYHFIIHNIFFIKTKLQFLDSFDFTIVIVILINFVSGDNGN
jgi:hypothetical protein